jgi:hypothetical protein
MAFGSHRVIIAYIGVWDIVMIVTDPCDRNQKEKANCCRYNSIMTLIAIYVYCQ